MRAASDLGLHCSSMSVQILKINMEIISLVTSHNRHVYLRNIWSHFQVINLFSFHRISSSYMSRHTKKGTYGSPICGSSNAHAQSPIWAKDMRFCLKLPKGLYFMSVNSKGFCETALMRTLTLTFTGHLCDKYLFIMCWLLCCFTREKRRAMKYIYKIITYCRISRNR